MALLFASGCASVQAPVNGVFYLDAQGGVAPTANPIGSVRGEACATTILGLMGTGDASIKAAAASAGITRVTLVDHSSSNILGIYGKYCTVVYGMKGKVAAAPRKAAKPAAAAAVEAAESEDDF